MRYRCFILFLIVILSTAISPAGEMDRETMTQISTLGSLLAAHYDGLYPFGDLERYGDFGIGTFDSLDGEMVALDGQYYQVRVDGRVYEVTDEMKTPFATVTFFDTDTKLSVSDMDYDQLKEYLDERLEKDFFYAIRLDGEFSYVKTRSVTDKKPYRPLVEIVKDQAVFEMKNVKGTLVGMFCPDFVGALNVPGHHFHFLTEDRKAGGHVLALEVKQATGALDKTPGFNLILPPGFESADADQEAIDRVEKDSPEKENRYTLVFDKDWPPFCYVENGESKGFLLDVAMAVADASGFKLEFQPMQWSDAQEAVIEGKAHLTTGMAKSEERLEKYEFALAPAAAIGVKLYVRSDSDIPSIDRFEGSLKVEKGSLYSKLMKERYPDIPQLLSESERKSIIEFASGEGDGCIGADLAMNYYKRSGGLEGIKAVGTPLEILNIYFTTKKGETQIMEKWNSGFARIQSDGQYTGIFRKWFVDELSGEETARLVGAAEKARSFAYAPYSHYGVGAAVLSKSGNIYTGCNVENALLSLTTSALRVAVLKAVSEGDSDIRAIVNILDDGTPGAPTGDERQLVYEFGRGVLIILEQDDGYVTKTIGEIFPYPFEMNK